jgi:hypothetical protein
MKRFLLPSPAISLRRLFVCLVAIGLIGVAPAIAGPLDITANRTESSSANYQGGVWSGGNLFINDSVTTTLDAGNTWVLTNSFQHQWRTGTSVPLTGKLVNNGTIRLDFPNLWRSNQGQGSIVENYGLIDMVRSGCEIYCDIARSTIFNYTGAVFQASGESGLRGMTQPGGFVNDGGTVRATNGATLQIRCASSNPGRFLSGTIDSTDGTVRFGFFWSNITATAVGGPLKFGSGQRLEAGAELTVINVSGEGVEIDANNQSIDLNNNTLENAGLMKVSPGATINIYSSSGGDVDTFHNSGTFIADVADLLFNGDTSSVASNTGTWIVTNTSHVFDGRHTGITFVNAGTLKADSVTSARLGVNGTFKNYNGTVIADDAALRIDFPSGLNNSVGGEYISTNGGSITLSGGWSNFNSTVTGGSIYLHSVRFNALAPLTEFNTMGDEFYDWSGGGAAQIHLNSNILRFNRFATSGSSTRVIGSGDSAGGHLIVTDYFRQDHSSYIDVYECYSFRNEGTWEFANTSGDAIHLRNSLVAGEFAFSNTVSGIITQGVSGTSSFVGQTANSGIFVNEGKVVVTAGTISWDLRWVIGSQTGGTLDEGTWECLGGSLTFPTDHSNIDTIDTAAVVRLGSSGSISKLTTASFDTLSGTFGLQRGRQWTTGGAFTSDSDANFEFGLDNTGSDALLEITGNSTLDGVIDVVDLDGDLPPSSFVVVTNSGGTTLTDNGIGAGTLTSSQNLQMFVTVYAGANGYVEVGFSPPPSGAVYLIQ